ncbi:MAG: hypothetical protein J6T22_09470 [Bacteroidales bacterium]|nr:hypothetical protein [Bacteroidales bacterium]MBO7617423.1 hypothetical protein [Bacteroidales bacterium]
MKREIYIGIDPDVELSGFAVLNYATRKLELASLSFTGILAALMRIKAEGVDAVVVVEAGWMNKGNWHLKFHDNRGVAAAKGYQVGRNHEAGKKIIEAAQFFGYEVVEQKPLKKIWKGKDRKITRDELAVFTGYNKSSNQDSRDAALLAWNAANLPIIMNSKFQNLIR